MEKEVFKPIKGYEKLYAISNYGRVRALRDRSCRGFKLQKNSIMKPTEDKKGYFYISIHKDGIHKKTKVHRLVAQAFIKNPKNLPQVNHKDSDKGNNYYKNLEWCDNRYNRNHYFKTQIKYSKYPGVSYDKRTKVWISRICFGGTCKWLGRHKKEIDAANIYQKELLKLGR